jgi:hypothetical protein
MKQTQERAKILHSQMLAEFSGKTLSLTEKVSTEALIQRLKQFTLMN